MDYNDFLSLARDYDYDPVVFLESLKKAGLTSLALTEELGGNVGSANNAVALAGPALLNQARVGGVAAPTLSTLVRQGRVRPDEVYLVVYDDPTFARYREQLPLHFERKGIHVIHASKPYVIAIRTQMDYFSTTGLGIPQDQIALARRLRLLIIPRFQNDERFTRNEIERELALTNAERHISTVVFFGLRNQVMGFPDHINDMADAFKAHKSMNFGQIETYDKNQEQKGNDTLAKLIPGRTVRVQAISKLEQDKLQLDEIVARYELGARERNVRVIYLRPYAHQYNGLSIEKSNVEMVRQIADDLHARGFLLKRAAPIPQYHGNNRILVGLAALAVPSIFVLLLAVCGWYRPWYAIAAYALTILIYAGGLLSHHDLLARSAIALAGALLFSAAAFSVLAPAFAREPERSF